MKRPQALVAAAALAAAGAGAVGAWMLWPPAAALTAPPRVASLVIVDRHGLPLRTTRAADGSRTSWLPLSAIDPQLIQAFVAL